jgi:hypothetical protein
MPVLTQTEAEVLLNFLASVVVPFAASWLKQPSWPKPARFAVAAVLSVLGALLAQYLAGALDGGSVILAAIGVFTAAQAHYRSWFEGLGLEDWLNPPAS